MVLLQLAHWVKEGNDAFIQVDLVFKCEINQQCVIQRVYIQKLRHQRDLFNVKQIIEAEQRVYVETWL